MFSLSLKAIDFLLLRVEESMVSDMWAKVKHEGVIVDVVSIRGRLIRSVAKNL